MASDLWDDNLLQFARLLAEIKAVGLLPAQMYDLCDSMDLDSAQIQEILDRAEIEFEKAKEGSQACTACGGSGYYDNTGSPPCGSCNGTGERQ
jgi:hypothetical protein